VPPTLSSQRPPAAAAPSVGSATSAQSRPAASARSEPPATTQSRPASEQPEATSAPAAEADKPSAAESPTAASTIGVTDVRRVWPEVLTAVQRQRRTTQILLESATVVGVDAGVLQVAMPSAGMARRVLEPANSDLLRAALKELLGVDWTIRCEAVGAGGPASDANMPPRGSTGGPPSASLGRTAIPDPPPPPPEDDIPDDYGEPPDPSAASESVRDPEEIAIALLSAELGARRLDPSAQ
jgi:DNA polymerase-3 subunit gamma/tau